MSGFEAGNSQGAIGRAKQFGSILRGFGPPVPSFGVAGDIYVDVTTFQLFERRLTEGTDPWGHYLFVIPPTYQSTLKYFGTAPPPNDLGVPGDYYMQWGGFPNYGISPLVYGPRQTFGWPENASGPTTQISITNGTLVVPTGLNAEGATISDQALAQLIATGLNSEAIIAFPVTAASGDPVLQEGLQTSGSTLVVTINPRYTAIDNFAVP